MNPYVGEIRVFSFDKVPSGWLECSGQSLPVTKYMELYSLIGTKYGGDGTTKFNLPKLSGIGEGTGKAKYFISIEGTFPTF